MGKKKKNCLFNNFKLRNYFIYLYTAKYGFEKRILLNIKTSFGLNLILSNFQKKKKKKLAHICI